MTIRGLPPFLGFPWEQNPGVAPEPGQQLELSTLLEQVTVNELDNVISQMSLQERSLETPAYFREQSKTSNVKQLFRWARGAPPEMVEKFRTRLEDVVKAKAVLPIRGPHPGTRQILWRDFEKLPSFHLIERAITFPFSYTHRASPVTRDGYVSVAAIYNMSAWANWKSSSLDDRERAIADAINQLGLGVLMQLNHGRRKDQPALFPVRMLPA